MEILYLAHHGILGQKWGIRRYQNPDGSLTEAGRRRHYKTAQRVLGAEDAKAIKRGMGSKEFTGPEKELVDRITSNSQYKKAKTRFDNTPVDVDFDLEDNDYLSPEENAKITKSAVEEFERNMGRKPDLENRQDSKAIDYIIDDIKDRTGVYDRAAKLAAESKWNRAWTALEKATKQAVDEFVGQYGDEKLSTWKDAWGKEESLTYREYVNDLLYRNSISRVIN